MIALLTEVIHAVETIGDSATIDILRSLRPSLPIQQEDTINIIVNTTCVVFGIPRKVLMEGGSSYPARVQARDVCFFFIRKILKMQQAQIGQQFKNTDPASVSRGIRYIHNLDPNSRADQQLLVKIEKIEAQINTYLKDHGRK